MFTETEKKIIKELKKGYPNKKIAEVLGISSNTVMTYLGRIYQRLNIHNRVELLNEVAKRNLL